MYMSTLTFASGTYYIAEKEGHPKMAGRRQSTAPGRAPRMSLGPMANANSRMSLGEPSRRQSEIPNKRDTMAPDKRKSMAGRR
jgi:hypothetical protein